MEYADLCSAVYREVLGDDVRVKLKLDEDTKAPQTNIFSVLSMSVKKYCLRKKSKPSEGAVSTVQQSFFCFALVCF